MTGRHDKDYQNIIAKLNQEFGQDRKEPVSVSADKPKMQKIEEISESELRKIQEKLCADVTEIGYLNEKEKLLLADINDYMKLNYKIATWKLTGRINLKQIMKDYTRFVQDNEVFRTVYFYKGLAEPVRVVYESREVAFPVHDIRSMDKTRQNLLIKSVMASEARREYNLETDSRFRMKGYLTGPEELLVIISVYPYLPYPVGMREMLYRIFDGMKPESSNVSGTDEQTLRKMYAQLNTMSIDYWKGLLSGMGRSLPVPGERAGKENVSSGFREKALLCKELGEELTTQITEYSGRNGVSLKAIFLHAWAELLGRYHNEDNPVLAVANWNGNMNVIPVKTARNKDMKEEIQEIDRQLVQSLKHTNCNVKDIENAVGISFAEYFRILHDFEGLGEKETENDFYSGDTEINLCISYQMLDQNIMMNYVSKGGILELMLENLHEMFLDELSAIVQPDNARFDKKTFIKIDDSEEERLYKLQLAQVALYLKNTGLFDTITVEEIMKLAQYCTFRSYLQSDAIVTEGSRLSSIYILGDGKLEESRMDTDGMVKSLRIVKKDSVFGIESLFTGAKAAAHTTYTVVGTQAKIVEMDKNILIEVLRRKPEGWIALLEAENDQKCKLQRLWTME